MSAGKRGASGPLVTTSDEEEQPDSPRSSRSLDPTFSPTSHDHDYENVSSPSSSTASGPIYVRQPGFTQHAHEVTVSKPRIKKKKTNVFPVKDGIRRREPTPPKAKPKRDPLPMRMRALPQSFWQQPNVPHHVSPANNYSILPPLINREGESIADERPITPVDEKQSLSDSEDPPRRERQNSGSSPTLPSNPSPSSSSTTSTATSTGHANAAKTPRPPERKITITNTDLLLQLFEGIEKKDSSKKPSIPQIKRGRPRKFVPCSNKTFVSGEDPYLMECVTEKLFPQLNLEQSRAVQGSGGTTLQLVTIREGDKSITLPSLSVEQNYSQMLSELVMHI